MVEFVVDIGSFEINICVYLSVKEIYTCIYGETGGYYLLYQPFFYS